MVDRVIQEICDDLAVVTEWSKETESIADSVGQVITVSRLTVRQTHRASYAAQDPRTITSSSHSISHVIAQMHEPSGFT